MKSTWVDLNIIYIFTNIKVFMIVIKNGPKVEGRGCCESAPSNLWCLPLSECKDRLCIADKWWFRVHCIPYSAVDCSCNYHLPFYDPWVALDNDGLAISSDLCSKLPDVWTSYPLCDQVNLLHHRSPANPHRH